MTTKVKITPGTQSIIYPNQLVEFTATVILNSGAFPSNAQVSINLGDGFVYFGDSSGNISTLIPLSIKSSLEATAIFYAVTSPEETDYTLKVTYTGDNTSESSEYNMQPDEVKAKIDSESVYALETHIGEPNPENAISLSVNIKDQTSLNNTSDYIIDWTPEGELGIFEHIAAFTSVGRNGKRTPVKLCSYPYEVGGGKYFRTKTDSNGNAYLYIIGKDKEAIGNFSVYATRQTLTPLGTIVVYNPNPKKTTPTIKAPIIENAYWENKKLVLDDLPEKIKVKKPLYFNSRDTDYIVLIVNGDVKVIKPYPPKDDNRSLEFDKVTLSTKNENEIFWSIFGHGGTRHSIMLKFEAIGTINPNSNPNQPDMSKNRVLNAPIINIEGDTINADNIAGGVKITVPLNTVNYPAKEGEQVEITAFFNGYKLLSYDEKHDKQKADYTLKKTDIDAKKYEYTFPTYLFQHYDSSPNSDELRFWVEYTIKDKNGNDINYSNVSYKFLDTVPPGSINIYS